jgi:hypothetical protein
MPSAFAGCAKNAKDTTRLRKIGNTLINLSPSVEMVVTLIDGN